MKNRQTLCSLIYAIMKFSGLQILIVFFLSGTVIASPVDTFGQSVLEEIISINAENEKVKNVLLEIEKTVKIKFTYNPQTISVNHKVSFDFQSQKLSEVLDGIFRPLNINYELLGNYIILRKQDAAVTGQVTENNSKYVSAFTVSGTVQDEEGAAIPGVNVVVKGSTIGTTTDSNGKYTITVADGTETLVFSFIGYALKEVTINNQAIIDVTMATDITSLDEVVVIGYGTAEKKEITSAVASVDAKDFNKGNVFDPTQLLQGKVAGLSMAKAGSDPNAGYTIRLRGLSTFGASTSPLIVIDGVLGGSLQSVDPNEIESMSVLKDGSAAAIYGTRASAGVIIITTKKGSEGASGFDYNGTVSFESIANSVEIASYDRYLAEGGQDLGGRTDWLKEVTRTGVSKTHNLGIYGSSGPSNYRLSMNYREVEGIAKGNGFEQLNTRLNLSHSALNDKLILSSTLGVTVRDAEFVPVEALRFALISKPTAPVYINNDPLQGYAEPNSTEYHNPVAIINETTDDGQFKTMLATLKADYELMDGLSVSAFYSMQYENDMRSQYFSSRMRFAGSAGLSGRATKFTEDRSAQLTEFTASYKKNFNKLALNVVAGYSYQKNVFSRFSAFNTGFITDELLYNNLGLGLGVNSPLSNLRGFGSKKEESMLSAFFGRAMFNYDDKFFITAAYRREGSSRFGKNNRWGDFYSVSGGVDISRIVETPLDVLKIRAGYGVTGALPPGNYDYTSLLSSSGDAFTTFNDGTTDRNIRLFGYQTNSNPDLKWEQKGELNLGLDFALLNNRLTGSFDYYDRTTKDLIYPQVVSQPPNLANRTMLNLGDMNSKGIEVLLNYNVINNTNLSWTTGITYSRNRTKVVTLNGEGQVFNGGNLGPPGLNGVVPIRAAIGQPLGLITAPIYLGLDENGIPTVEPVVDANGDGSINQRDWPVVGNGLPKFELAWNNGFSYKNFDLSLTMRGSFGHSLVNVNRAYYEVPQNRSNYNLVVTKYYDPERTGGEAYNSYYVEKAGFFKLDNISLGYNFKFTNSPFKSLRLYVTGQNLFVITDYTGVDPEVRYAVPNGPVNNITDYFNNISNALYPGVDDRNTYFRSKTYSVGVNIGF
jgi:iron complex outermembrane receptor protein